MGKNLTYTISRNIFKIHCIAVPPLIRAVMMIGAALLGLSAAPLWTAKSSYMTELGIMYAKISGETKEAAINRFFGVFFFGVRSSTDSGRAANNCTICWKSQLFRTSRSQTKLKDGAHKCSECGHT